MKETRQALILEMIARESVPTQERLLALLRAEGVSATQATISRDVKELNLIKEPSDEGGYRYAASRPAAPPVDTDAASRKLRGIFRDSVHSVQAAQNLVVVKTMPGLASAACSALDGMAFSDIVGSLAGDDTAFLAMRDAEAARAFCGMLKRMLA